MVLVSAVASVNIAPQPQIRDAFSLSERLFIAQLCSGVRESGVLAKRARVEGGSRRD